MRDSEVACKSDACSNLRNYPDNMRSESEGDTREYDCDRIASSQEYETFVLEDNTPRFKPP